jgi:hypothetical protein
MVTYIATLLGLAQINRIIFPSIVSSLNSFYSVYHQNTIFYKASKGRHQVPSQIKVKATMLHMGK